MSSTIGNSSAVQLAEEPALQLERAALREFSGLHAALRKADVDVQMFSGEREHRAPDAVFPNNWFSTHIGANGCPCFVLYPMKPPSRRNERRHEIICWLRQRYSDTKEDARLLSWENASPARFLEGTGSLVLDRANKIAYVSLSQRADLVLAQLWSRRMQYRLVTFQASDAAGRPIYHTNVVLSVGSRLAVFCAEAVSDEAERKAVVASLGAHRQLLLISLEQLGHFCGNVLELSNRSRTQLYLAMSSRARGAFTAPQLDLIARHGYEILHSDLDVIERIGGGSARCMLAELY
jgi:hypothetical protein